MAIATLLIAGILLGLVGPLGGVRADVGIPRAAHLQECIARQGPGDTPARLFAQPQRFDCGRPARAWGPGNFWVRFTMPAGSSIAAARGDAGLRQFRFQPQWQRELTVSTRDAGGRIVSTMLDDVTLSRLTRVGNGVGIALDPGGQPVTDIMFRIDGAMNASGLVGDAQLTDLAELHREALIATAVVAAFGGLGLGLFCYNLVLWLTIRERFQYTYCLSLFAMLAYAATNSGLIVQAFPDLPHTLRLATSYVLLGFVAALALQFITDFIEPDKLPPRLRSFARHYGIVCVLAGVVVWLVPPEWRYAADRLFVLSFIPMPILVVVMTAIAWRRGSQSVRVLAIAWAIPVGVAVLRIAHALNLVESRLIVPYALIVGMSMEAMLSSLAMSYRIKLITQERDRARADERVARRLADIDSLTGLLNRRALLDHLVARRSPQPLRLMLIDIDRFKLINDSHGHFIGDEVLRGVAEVLALRADNAASVARLGGEEFALVGSAAELPEAVALGILADIRSRPMAAEARVTVSIGMAEGVIRSEGDWQELYRRADAALYQAKSDGRNRAVHAASPGLPGGHVIAA